MLTGIPTTCETPAFGLALILWRVPGGVSSDGQKHCTEKEIQIDFVSYQRHDCGGLLGCVSRMKGVEAVSL
jgi:hypothetical protein